MIREKILLISWEQMYPSVHNGCLQKCSSSSQSDTRYLLRDTGMEGPFTPSHRVTTLEQDFMSQHIIEVE